MTPKERFESHENATPEVKYANGLVSLRAILRAQELLESNMLPHDLSDRLLGDKLAKRIKHALITALDAQTEKNRELKDLVGDDAKIDRAQREADVLGFQDITELALVRLKLLLETI